MNVLDVTKLRGTARNGPAGGRFAGKEQAQRAPDDMFGSLVAERH